MSTQVTENDFYGYTRSGTNQFLYSTDYASVIFDNTGIVPQSGGSLTPAGNIGLVQSVNCVYQHNVQARFEAGSSQLFWLAGQARGVMDMGRLVSSNGLLDGVSFGGTPQGIGNGAIGGVNLQLSKGKTTVNASDAKSHLVLKACVLSSYSVTFATGGLEVAEMIRIECGLVKRGQGNSTDNLVSATAGTGALTGALAGGLGVNLSATASAAI